MHPIPVRRMRFEVPAHFEPAYMAGSAGMSYSMTGLGLYVAILEPFIVKSLRRVLDRIRDDALRENVDRFCRQEAQHYMQHDRFNALVLAQGYDGLAALVQGLRDDFEHFLAAKDDRFRVGFIEGFEANTTQGALFLIGSGVFDHPKTDPAFGALFQWHMLEEIEHRDVAFDVYQHLYGDWLYRARMCWVAQRHMAVFQDRCTALMSAVDVARFGERYRVKAKDRRRGMLMRAVPRLRSMLPTYTPHAYVVPPSVGALSARLTLEAESAT
jgi:predicted metal-dependent hydrolase